MKSLRFSRSTEIYSAYIIYLPGNNASEMLAQRAQTSCGKIQQKCELWPGFDGTGPDIIVPAHCADQSWVKWLKTFDHWQSPTEIACSLSHISLWAWCMEIDRPIVILEHDAIMTKSLQYHRFLNTVQYLGCKEQKQFDREVDAVPMSAINENWWFINRAHAYSIDPCAARRLFTMVLERGIFESLDVMIMTDMVAIIQDGIYAHDDPIGITTITHRKQSNQRGPGSIKIS